MHRDNYIIFFHMTIKFIQVLFFEVIFILIFLRIVAKKKIWIYIK